MHAESNPEGLKSVVRIYFVDFGGFPQTILTTDREMCEEHNKKQWTMWI